jgi:hypothetical protein
LGTCIDVTHKRVLPYVLNIEISDDLVAGRRRPEGTHL